MMDELACTGLRLNVEAAQAVLECPEPGLRQLVIAGGLNPKPDFRGADLRGWPLAGQDVRGFDFTNADLRGTGIETAIKDKTTRLKGAIRDLKARKAPPPIPKDFIEQAQEMILAGKKPPAHWVPRITELNFYRTDLADLTPLAGLTALQYLYCNGTQVSDLTPVSGIADLTIRVEDETRAAALRATLMPGSKVRVEPARSITLG